MTQNTTAGRTPVFRFSPRPNRAAEIHWREWGEESFQSAQHEGKPVLLSLSAVWCHWCHVMDETSYSDPQVIELINQRFVPVRVDNDRRLDINQRYNMGGWPTTAFLSPDGEVLTGGTYIPPDQMRQLLDQVSTAYQQNRAQIEERVARLRAQRREAAAEHSAGPLRPETYREVLGAVQVAYDPLYGGFGEAPKFPHPDSTELLLYAYDRDGDVDSLHMARKTLELMATAANPEHPAYGLYDHVWGGFFRYSTTRDWTVPHFEKMLEDNARLLRNYLHLYRLRPEALYRQVAEGVIAYLDSYLSDPATGAFYGSQDADEEFYAYTAEERRRHPAPSVDPTVYTSWCAMAISAYLEASWTLGRPELAERALRALAFLWNECREPGAGMYRFHDGVPQVQGILEDQIHTLEALLDAAEVAGDSSHLDRAQELAAFVLGAFQDEEVGGFWDIGGSIEPVGRLERGQKSISENAVAADAFTRLAHLMRDERYRGAAQGALAAFGGRHESFGSFAAAYARALDRFLSGEADVNIVGAATDPATRQLLTAALALPVPARTVQVLDPARDGGRLAAFFLPAEPSPAAYACVGTACSPPVRDAAALAESVQQMRALVRATG